MAAGLDLVLTETHEIVQRFTNVNLTSVNVAIVQMGKLDDAVAETRNKMKENFLGVAGTVLDFSKGSIAAYSTLRSADEQNMQAIINSGGAAGKTFNQLSAEAKRLSGITLFDPAATAGAQASLLAFTDIKGAIFDEAIPAIQDMAQSMAGGGEADLKGASERVATALHDPIQGMKDLGDIGVEFSESQKASITSMIENKDAAGAQGIIIEQLTKKFGGAAIAAREAAGGQADFDMSVKNLQVGFGELLEIGLNPFLSVASFLVDTLKSTVDWFVANKEVTTYLTIGLAALGAGFMAFQGYLLLTQARMAIITAAQWAWNAATSANPIGIIITGLGALAGGIVVAYHHFDVFRAGIDGIIATGSILGEVFMGVGKVMLGMFTADPMMLIKGIKETINAGKKVVDGTLADLYNEGYAKSIAKSAAAEKERKAKEEKNSQGVNGATLATPPSTFKYGAADTGKRNNAIGLPGGRPVAFPETVSTAVPGSSQVRNVQVTIGKLVENLTIATTTLQDNGSMDIKRIITEILTGAVHDSELILGN